MWGVLVEGLQPFLQWELQSGMGDFWEQVGLFMSHLQLHRVISQCAKTCASMLCARLLSVYGFVLCCFVCVLSAMLLVCVLYAVLAVVVCVSMSNQVAA